MSPNSAPPLGGLADVFADPGPEVTDRHPADPAATPSPATAAAPSGAQSSPAVTATGDAAGPSLVRRARAWVDQRRGGAPAETADPDTEAVTGRVNGPTRQVWITRGVQLAVVVALACGPLALMFGGDSSAPAPVATAPQTVITDISPQLTATDLANQCVTAWLQATQTDQAALGRCFDMTDSGVTTLPENAIYDASDARASAVHRVMPSPDGSLLYSVTVSVAVRPAGSTQPPTRRYYRLPVIVAQSSVRALALPAQVPAPPTSLTTKLSYQYQAAPDSAIVTAGAGFLSAMLTGTGDVTRFTSPGTHLSAITPAPATSVTVTVTTARSVSSVTAQDDTPADGQRNRLLLTLTERPVGAASGDTITTNYALSMTARAGRWEVTAIDLTPPLASVTGDQSDTALGDSQAVGNPFATPDTGTPTAATADSSTTAPTADAPATDTPAAATPGPTTSAPGPSTAPGLLAPGGSDLGPR